MSEKLDFEAIPIGLDMGTMELILNEDIINERLETPAELCTPELTLTAHEL